MILLELMLPVEDIAETFPDLAPLPQDDGPNPVCAIDYPTHFVLSYNYMRAVWKAKEQSERALKLTATCLKMNPANYTVWYYRRQCLQTLGWISLQDKIAQDLKLAAALGGENPKNYQVWYHRRALLENYHNHKKTSDNDASALKRDFLESELDYLAEVLESDSKNYHAWSHRQWLIKTLNQDDVWESELDFAHSLITKDVFNNSAWNERWFVTHRAQHQQPLALEVAKREADYAIEIGANLDPYNESCWRYLIGLIKEQQKQKHDVALCREYLEKTEALRKVLTDANQDPETCSNWTSARIDFLEMIGDEESLKKAVALAQGLANEYDKIRHKYWMLRVSQLEEKAAATS